MIITPDLEYPLMCTDVGWAATGGEEPELHLSLVNLNTGQKLYPSSNIKLILSIGILNFIIN